MQEEQQKRFMGNIKVLIFVESRYRADRKRITQAVLNLLKEQGVVGPAEVSLAIVGDRKMRSLNKKYRGKDATTNVLSFPFSEGEAIILPPVLPQGGSDILHLGDVVISYPQVIEEASREEKLVDDKIEELVIHGVLHLLGIHHEE